MTDPRELVLERLLVIACQAGDERAFEELVARQDARLRYYVRQMLDSADCADDVVQEVWIDVFRKIGTLRSPGGFRAWLYSIAHSRAIGELRKRLGRRAMERELTADLAADLPEEVERELAAEDAAGVHECLGKLSPEHREVLLLRFVEDMSYEEIAAAIGCPVGTVRSRIHYAKTALGRELERKEERCPNAGSRKGS